MCAGRSCLSKILSAWLGEEGAVYNGPFGGEGVLRLQFSMPCSKNLSTRQLLDVPLCSRGIPKATTAMHWPASKQSKTGPKAFSRQHRPLQQPLIAVHGRGCTRVHVMQRKVCSGRSQAHACRLLKIILATQLISTSQEFQAWATVGRREHPSVP